MGISSGPVALCGFSPAMSLYTQLTVIVMSGIVGYGLGPNLGRGLSGSVVNTDENWSFKISVGFYCHCMSGHLSSGGTLQPCHCV